VRQQKCIVSVATKAGFSEPAEDLLNATRIRLAERVDRGEITLAQRVDLFAECSQFVGLVMRRHGESVLCDVAKALAD
jgi:hypothetical protein